MSVVAFRVPIRSKTFQCKGVSLVLTLAFLVLLTALVTFFLSRAMTVRTISASSASKMKSEQIARAAATTTIADLIAEIEAGSDPDAAPEVLYPASSAAVRPHRMNANPGIRNLLKGSYPGEAFWPATTDYGGEAGPDRVFADASNATDEPAQNGRWLRRERWGAPQLHENADDFGVDFQVPHWIPVTMQGPVEETSTPPDFEQWSDPRSDRFVVGRYAFQIYDVGGLLDINVAGFLSPPIDQERAALGGHPAFADLAEFESAERLRPEDLVRWRHAGSLEAGHYSALYEPDGSEISFPGPGDQILMGRQDLLAAAHAESGLQVEDEPIIDPAMLPKLTVFSRTLNAPHWRPDPDRPRVDRPQNSAGPDDRMNPPPLEIRVQEEFSRRDGSMARQGEPLLNQRFPLSKINLLLTPSSLLSGDEERLLEIRNWFGLAPAADDYSWDYVDGNNRILRLDEVAAANREPNFFEILQAAILTGSLGSANNSDAATAIRSAFLDQNIFYQTIQIGANIIDQFDEDDWPTTIIFDDVPIHGVENLPGFYSFPAVVLRPPEGFADQNETQDYIMGWYQFGLWNPHQNATDAAPHRLRVHAVAGQAGPQAVGGGIVRDADPLHDFSADPAALEFLNDPTFVDLAFLDPGPLEHDSREVPVIASTGSEHNIMPDMPHGGNNNNIRRLGFAGFHVGRVFAPEPDLQTDAEEDEGEIWTSANVSPDQDDPPVFQLEIEVPGIGWRPYQRMEGLLVSNSGTGSIVLPYHQYLTAYPGTTHNARRPALARTGFNSIDPRVLRYGGYRTGNIRQMSRNRRAPGSTLGSMSRGERDQEASFPNVNHGPPRPGRGANSPWQGNNRYATLVDNRETNNNARILDPDGVLRPADGDSAIGAHPSLFRDPDEDKDYLTHRSVILNRPFRNVGELSYAFRGQPWKTLDFLNEESADFALLDYFSVEEDPTPTGRVDLNTPHEDILAALLTGILQQERGDQATLPQETARAVAEALVAESTDHPFLNLAEAAPMLSDPDLVGSPHKTEREAAIRALSETTQTRVWNVLIDLVAQSGRYPRGSTDFDDFVVEGETRLWLHVAIDRYSGRIVDTLLEVVKE